jgi:hypothetical protein
MEHYLIKECLEYPSERESPTKALRVAAICCRSSEVTQGQSWLPSPEAGKHEALFDDPFA